MIRNHFRLVFNREGKSTLRATGLLATLFLAGCATPSAPVQTGAVKVAYTTQFPDGGYVKKTPTEVTIVRRANTQKEVGKQVLLNVLMIGAGIGAAFNGFSKTELEGDTIELTGDRGNLANPVPEAFVSRLNTSISTAIQADRDLAPRSWRHPIYVASGRTRLLYKDLDGTTEERFSLAMDLKVYKRKETASALSFNPTVIVDCSSGSDQSLPLADWSASQYQRVKTEMDTLLNRCEQKVMTALPDMLKE